MLSQFGHMTLYMGIRCQFAGRGRYTYTSDLGLVFYSAKGCKIPLVCEGPAGMDE